MNKKVLVAYASRYGSTQEVAEAIAGVLREKGLNVDLQPMRKVRTTEGNDGVVLGAAFYFGLWHKDAINFLSRNEVALTKRPVAIFALGPTSKDEKEMKDCRAQLDKALAKFPWLSPVAIEMFCGKYPARLRFPDSLVAGLPASPLHGKPASDVRDWEAIRDWTDNLAAQLQPVIPQ